MTEICACNTQTLLKLRPELLAELREKIIKEDSEYSGNLSLKTSYSVKREGREPILLYVTDADHEVAPYIEGKAPVECYDPTRATVKNAVLRYYKKTSEAQIDILSNLTPWAVRVGTRSLLGEESSAVLDSTMDVLMSIPNKAKTFEWRPSTKEEYSDAQLITLFTGTSPDFQRHKQLLQVFGQTLLDNNTLRLEFRESPHRLISAFHLVADFVGLEETKQHAVAALGEVLEVAEMFLIPEPIFQELSDLCYRTYTRTWDVVDVNTIVLAVDCTTPVELEMEIDWFFELPLKCLPEGVALESLCLSTKAQPQLVHALMQATDSREYVFQKKTYDKAATVELTK